MPSADIFFELVLHERDQGRNYDGHSRHEHRWHLVAQRLPGTSGHDRERVPTFEHRVDHRLLPRSKACHTKHSFQNGCYSASTIWWTHDYRDSIEARIEPTTMSSTPIPVFQLRRSPKNTMASTIVTAKLALSMAVTGVAELIESARK